MEDNYAKVQRGFRILHPLLAGYIAQEMSREYKDGWWQQVLMDVGDQARDLPERGDFGELVDSLDIANCLRLFDREWGPLFRRKLSIDCRTWAKELMGVRNKFAHIGGKDFSDADAWRYLDTMARLCEPIDDEGAEEIRSLLREVRYGTSAGSGQSTSAAAVSEPAKPKAKDVGILNYNVQGLPSWRDVIEPHPDVAQGRYKNAEFAADLAQVARGEGAYEYRDPVEFFSRTYVTEGMTGLLVQGLKRVTGKDGEPVIQLKTAFGGGKTHSILALYHMMRGRVSVDKVPNLKPVLAQAGVSTLPKANVAVLVGTALDPTSTKRPQDFPGITINTVWGEMAYQLAKSAGNLSLYKYVKEADKKGATPGSEAFKNLFDACGPCLILMDELVAYAKKLYGVSGLPAGSFDNFITFIQEVTEAARASKNSMVVASIPESDIEIGGEGGKQALEAIEHTFGRMESIWKPVAANEGFEVVRRRLFLECKDPSARDRICTCFSQMYQTNSSDFPLEAKEADYRERMIACYPIHPEIFDRLYEDWATLERFQRTRGVLRLMAAVIHELWMGNDGSAMIMPGSIQMDVPNVRDELTRHLNEGWNAIVDREVDGKKSVPYQLDKDNQRYSKNMAARRVARTIMLGSAPTNRGQSVRGIEAKRIRLGVVQPGEIIANFNDALNALQGALAYLYSNGDRYWYDTRPTLRKTVEDRAAQLASADVEYEIIKRVGEQRKKGSAPFGSISACPNSSLDVPDDQTVHLVLLRPEDGHRSTMDEAHDLAIQRASDILSNRGTAPRIYRNMLAFVAPDLDTMESLRQEVRKYLAWTSIKNDSEALNLDAAQNRETDANIKRSNDAVERQLKDTYCWLLVPYIDRKVDMNVHWETVSIRGGSDSIVKKAAAKMAQNEALISKWAPALLLMELDNVLWTESDSIQIKKLWDYLCTYCYLPRLANFNVLQDAIQTGLNSDEYFALAAGKSGERFLDLKYNQYVGFVDASAYLVKIEAAQKQLEEEHARAAAQQSASQQAPAYTTVPLWSNDNTAARSGVNSSAYTTVPASTGIKSSVTLAQPEPPKNTRFYMSAQLDTTRINRDVQRLVEEVISHLANVDGSHLEVSLEVNVDAPKGVPQTVVRTVSENCQTLKVKDFGFDD